MLYNPSYLIDSLGFGEVYVNTPLAVCVSRNKDRPIDKRIDENTICKISQRLEAPDPTAHSWEIYNIDSGTASVADLMRYVIYVCVEICWFYCNHFVRLVKIVL